MIIIGKSKCGFIVEMEKRELESIIEKPREDRLEVGSSFNIDEVFDDATHLVDTHKIAIDAAIKLQESASLFISYFDKKGAA